MFELTKWIVTLAYLSIALELLVFHVPSVASTVNIWKPSEQLLAFYSKKFRALFQLPKFKKIIVFVLPLVLIYITFFFPLFHFWWQADSSYLLFLPTDVSYMLGIALILLGRWVTFSSVLTIREENRQEGNSFKLHTDSLFARTRNPGLVGMYFFFAGLWACIPSWIFLLGILVYIAHMHFKVLMEEDFLHNKYGKPYRHYFMNTKRYIL